jgi:hypothetical protein
VEHAWNTSGTHVESDPTFERHVAVRLRAFSFLCGYQLGLGNGCGAVSRITRGTRVETCGMAEPPKRRSVDLSAVLKKGRGGHPVCRQMVGNT